LRDHLEECKLSREKAAIMTKELNLALQYVWSKGIYHNDVKEENIMVMEDRTIRLIDFGLAGTSDTGRDRERLVVLIENIQKCCLD